MGTGGREDDAMIAVQMRVSSSPCAASTPPLSKPAMCGRMGAHEGREESSHGRP